MSHKQEIHIAADKMTKYTHCTSEHKNVYISKEKCQNANDGSSRINKLQLKSKALKIEFKTCNRNEQLKRGITIWTPSFAHESL